MAEPLIIMPSAFRPFDGFLVVEGKGGEEVLIRTDDDSAARFAAEAANVATTETRK